MASGCSDVQRRRELDASATVHVLAASDDEGQRAFGSGAPRGKRRRAVQAAIGNLSDDDVIRSIAAAGYTDILEAFELEVPPSPEAPAEGEGEAAAVEGVPA